MLGMNTKKEGRSQLLVLCSAVSAHHRKNNSVGTTGLPEAEKSVNTS
jgi:hypothetical protein